jgi:hypothetical protein
MRRAQRFLCVALLAFAVLGCNQRTDKDEGSVILSITDFDGLPIRVNVNNSDLVQVEEFELRNSAKDPTGTTSSLQDIEIRSMEVTYTRADRGTRNPPTRVSGLFGIVTVNNTTIYNNLPIMGLDQLRNPPLSDLLFENGGFDKETGARSIQVNVGVRFFGRTLAGDNIASNTATWVIELVP